MRKKKESVTDIKQIIELVREKRTKDASDLLNTASIRKAAPSMTSRLLFELIPLTGRSAKEMMNRIFEHGKWSLKEKNKAEMCLLDIVMDQQKTSILAELLSKVKKQELKREPLRTQCTGILKYLLFASQKTTVKELLEKDILLYIEEEEKNLIYQKIVSFKDEDMLVRILKAERELPAEMFSMPRTASERQFTRRMLNKYAKYIPLEEQRDMLWETALECGAERLIWRMLKKKKDYQYLSRIAANSDEVFSLLEKMKPGRILDEVKKDVLLSALQSDMGRNRMDLLWKRGWDKMQNKKETISIMEDYKKTILNKKYEKNKKGELEKKLDRGKFEYLISYEAGNIRV